MNNIGIRLREERNKLGLSQEKLAEVGGVQKLAQTNYETGKRSPTGDYLVKIAEIGADVNYILTGVRVKGGGRSAIRGMTNPLLMTEKEKIILGIETGDSGSNDDNMSPKRKKMLELLERLDDDALDDAIYSTKKLVESVEERQALRSELMQVRKFMQKQAMAA